MLKIQKLFQIVFLSVVLEFVESSYGDRSPYFQECLIANTPRCKENGYPAVLSWQLKIFGWTCLDELKYTCMHNTTKLMIELGGKIYQFYGKVCMSFLLCESIKASLPVNDFDYVLRPVWSSVLLERKCLYMLLLSVFSNSSTHTEICCNLHLAAMILHQPVQNGRKRRILMGAR